MPKDRPHRTTDQPQREAQRPERAIAPEDLAAILQPAPAPLPPPEGFAGAAAAEQIAFDPGDLEKLGLYLALLLRANEAFNLTSITDPAEAWRKHILDSLTLLAALADLPEGARVIDVGSGGGLPGIPLAIAMPHLRFTLLESTGKKCEFLRRAVQILGLSNVRVACDRAENAAHDRGAPADAGGRRSHPTGHRESYDAVVARAVGRLATLAELTVPFAKLRAGIYLIKGAKAEEELAEAAGAMSLLNVAHTETIPTSTGRIVVLEKRGATARAYPRRSGEPKRSPLGVKHGGGHSAGA